MRTDQTETRGPDRNGTGRKNATETGAMQPWNFAAGEWSDMGRSIMRMNIEAATLASPRTQAYLELPGQLAACRQPQDIMALQMSFWQTCMRQYAGSMRRMGFYAPGIPGITGLEESLSDPESAPLKSTGTAPVEHDLHIPAQRGAPAKSPATVEIGQRAGQTDRSSAGAGNQRPAAASAA